MDFTKYFIRYWCDFNPGTGFNNAARGYLQAFKRLGLDSRHIHLAPAVLSDFGATDDDLYDWTAPYTHRVSADDVVEAVQAGREPPPTWDDDKTKINIVHLSPGMIAQRALVTTVGSRYNVAITAWETDKLPLRPSNRDEMLAGVAAGKSLTAAEALDEYDEVWVPTRHNKAVLEASGVRKPIYVIPHVLLPELLERPLAPPPPGPISFYTMGAWNARKDPALLLQTYLSLGWDSTTPVDLQLYCVPPTRDTRVMMMHQMRAQADVERILEGLPDRLGAVPHGLHTSRYVPYEEVLNRHERGHFYVSASHGEGFGLPALEAAALGRGVIAGGPWVEELAEVAGALDSGGLVDLLSTRKVPVTPMEECAGYEIGQNWWAVDAHELGEGMRAAYEALAGLAPDDLDYSEAFRCAQRVRAAYNPDTVAKEYIAARLQAIHEVLDGSGW